jgi:hypothetical protein
MTPLRKPMNLIPGDSRFRQKTCLWLFAFLAVPVCMLHPAFGRLGESYSECDARYGKPQSIRIEPGAQVRRYHKRGMEVAIRFWKGKSAEITYRKLNHHLMSDDEQQFSLSVNVATSSWAKVDQVAEWKASQPVAEGDPEDHEALMEDLASFYLWERGDGEAEASYDRREGILMISDVDHLERLAVREETDVSAPPVETYGF